MIEQTNIKINNELKKQLQQIQKENNYNTYTEAIQYLIQENKIKKHCIIQENNIILTLKCTVINENGTSYIYNKKGISYNELKNTQINEIITPRICETQYYTFKTAKIIYKDTSIILIKIHEIIKTPQDHNDFYEIIMIEI